MTIDELKNSKEFEYHHTGSRKGYVSRKTEGIVEKYNGRFGEGYKIVSPRFDTTQYVYVEYYIRVAK